MNARKCVLAYSGGLDTSAIVPWLIDRGYEVHAVLVDVGQAEDMPGLCEKALRIGAATAVIRDAKPAMFGGVIPYVIALGATYEGTYRLGTAIARPFIALEQVRRAKQLGGATLVHGATGKGNDQVRFEFGYRSLAPQYPVLAPWKVWDFGGRKDLIDYLTSKGLNDGYAVAKDYSLDENLWHLSIEGGPLEDPACRVDVEEVLAAMADRFAGGVTDVRPPTSATVSFERGVPTALDGKPMTLSAIFDRLNRQHRAAPWAWDLVIENRFTGIKSRGLYVNPAAKLLQIAADALARSALNKPTYDRCAALGRDYGAMLYRGEYFSDQRLAMEAEADAIMRRLTGTVEVQLTPAPYACRIACDAAIFSHALATFERSDYSHQDAGGFIRLSWLSAVGRPFVEASDADAVEATDAPAPDVRPAKPKSARRLVPAKA